MASYTHFEDKCCSLERPTRTIGKTWCYCFDTTPRDPLPYENRCFTECIISSLDDQQSATILVLTQSYEKQFASSSTALRSLISFLMDDSKAEATKDIVKHILCNHLHLYPGCHPGMLPTYTSLLLIKEEPFKNLTLLEYAISVLKSTLLKGHACFSVNRVSCRTRKKRIVFDGCTTETSTEEPGIPASSPINSEKEANLKVRLLWVIDYIREILEHELKSVLNRAEPVKSALISKLIFLGYDMVLLNKAFLNKIFALYKSSELTSHRENVAKLIELIAIVCNEADDLRKVTCTSLGYFGREFGSEFSVQVFGELKSEDFTMQLINVLELDWLRYYTAHFVFERIWNKKIPAGVQGVYSELNRVYDRQKCILLTTRDNNRSEPPGLQEVITACRKDDVEQLQKLSESGIALDMIDSNGRSALHVVAKHGSPNCTKFLLKTIKESLDIELEDKKGRTPLMYAVQNNHLEIQKILVDYGGVHNIRKIAFHRKLTPFVCMLMATIVSTSIKLIDKEDKQQVEDTDICLHKLSSILVELFLKPNLPYELKFIEAAIDGFFQT